MGYAKTQRYHGGPPPMNSSIYHFFKSLVDKKEKFVNTEKLESFEFNQDIVSASSKGVFPDLAIKINTNDDMLQGGELVELKDSKTYVVASFNSTIPTGRKNIKKLLAENSSIKQQMKSAGNNIESLPYRDVYYLIRGIKAKKQKIILVHGSFFETIPVEQLISKSFSKVIEDVIPNVQKNEMQKISKLFSNQKAFSKTRTIDEASVKLRFRVMTEVSNKANILNDKIYPKIKPNTINLVLPYEPQLTAKFGKVMNINKFRIIHLKHAIKGNFLVFQSILFPD